MTDSETKLEIINAEMLAEFHKARNVTNTACERCGTFNWYMNSVDPTGPIAALPTATDDVRANVDLFIPLIVLSCTNCGNVWLTNRSVYQHWKEYKAAQEASAEAAALAEAAEARSQIDGEGDGNAP